MVHVLRKQRYLTCSVYGLCLSYDPKVDRVNMCNDIRSCAEGALARGGKTLSHMIRQHSYLTGKLYINIHNSSVRNLTSTYINFVISLIYSRRLLH